MRLQPLGLRFTQDRNVPMLLQSHIPGTNPENVFKHDPRETQSTKTSVKHPL
jgi:hypothetical protein